MKRLELDLDYLAKTYGLDVLLTASVYVRDDGRTALVLEGESK